jgi:bifunctional non-homologous end joining protein LigD
MLLWFGSFGKNLIDICGNRMKHRKFVIQEHTTPRGIHWDLMLESDGVLLTFRLEEPPAAVLEHAVQAQKIFDHPLRFLTYEGPVQQETGRVRIVDRGLYQDRSQTNDSWRLYFEGETLDGDFLLTQIEDALWHFTCERHR